MVAVSDPADPETLMDGPPMPNTVMRIKSMLVVCAIPPAGTANPPPRIFTPNVAWLISLAVHVVPHRSAVPPALTKPLDDGNVTLSGVPIADPPLSIWSPMPPPKSVSPFTSTKIPLIVVLAAKAKPKFVPERLFRLPPPLGRVMVAKLPSSILMLFGLLQMAVPVLSPPSAAVPGGFGPLALFTDPIAIPQLLTPLVGSH